MMMIINVDDGDGDGVVKTDFLTDHIFPFLSWKLLNAFLEPARKPVSDGNDCDRQSHDLILDGTF